MTTIRRLIQQETRESFRLLVAAILGCLSFVFLSELSRQVILYFQPSESENLADSDGVLVLLFFLLGLVFLGVTVALVFEGLKRRNYSK
jgi:hypothetical protein